ncbi:hypothetical protein RUM43_004150 [Polyplax serrata]|uniref:Uncharacterized protein n=1 Tax=Polyplax serrata TaxID=468196 RepID=A0AAN8SAK7_POLSC
MACGEPSSSVMKQIHMAICQLCGRDMQRFVARGHAINYQKQVDPPATPIYDIGERPELPPDPVPHPKEFYTINEVPLITHTPVIEYRVTSEVRGKPANQTGVYHIMNHGFMDRADVMEWINKKKRMADQNLSWVGDGTYLETHPEMLHFYGNTTHLFLKNPDKPYGNSPDPPPPYKQIIPDYRYDELEEAERKKRGGHSNSGKVAPTQVCIQFPVVPGKSQTDSPGKDTTTEKSSPQKADESGAKDQSQPGGTASCLPAGCGGCPQPVKMMLCLPCPPPDCAGSSSAGAAASTPCNKNKPVRKKDYTYRCESRELRGGNLYQCCQCNKRNGLQHDCPRTPCQGRPACLTKPWPDCWPSGGCHGIDYTREKGVKRIDPCRESRFDKKECKPPGGAKADCGGNMMVVVCPPPSPC